MTSSERTPPVYVLQESLEPRRQPVAVAAARAPKVEQVAESEVLEDDLVDPMQEMLQQIEQALQQNKIERAEMLVERALRIDSQRAGLWHDLAQIRLRQSSWREVIVLARRSNGLAAGRAGLQKQNWSLIAEAKEALGDTAGARAAWKRVEE